MATAKYAKGFESLKQFKTEVRSQPATPFVQTPVATEITMAGSGTEKDPWRPLPIHTPREGWTIITPPVARAWLERYGISANGTSPKKAQRYAKIMIEKQWGDHTRVPLILDANMRWADGHHRLWAVAKSGVTLMFEVRTNAQVDAHRKIDIGSRTLGRIIGMDNPGAQRATAQGACASFILRYDVGGTSLTTVRPEKYEAADFVAKNPLINTLITKLSKTDGLSHVAAPVAAVLFLASRRYPTRAMDFATEFQTGEGLNKGSPVLALRKRFIRSRDKDLMAKTDERFLLAAMAWNAYIENRQLMKVQLPKEQTTFLKIKGAGER